jgi:hypothetical protein
MMKKYDPKEIRITIGGKEVNPLNYVDIDWNAEWFTPVKKRFTWFLSLLKRY